MWMHFHNDRCFKNNLSVLANQPHPMGFFVHSDPIPFHVHGKQHYLAIQKEAWRTEVSTSHLHGLLMEGRERSSIWWCYPLAMQHKPPTSLGQI